MKRLSFARARASWDFTVPSATPKICAVSLVLRPSNSRNWNAWRKQGESCSTNCMRYPRSSDL